FFFCQAEDGIRDRNVTGVQTCALLILSRKSYVKIIHLKDFFHGFTYFLNFGSNASCSPSPSTLKANIVNEMKKAGKNNVHQCPDKIALNESFAITPQLA